MEFDGHIKVAVVIIESGARKSIDAADTLEDKLRAAMKEGHQYWMSTDEDLRLRGSLGAVMCRLDLDSDDYRRIVTELESLRTLAAAMSGVPVDWGAVAIPDNFEPIGIMKLWEETRQ